MGMLATLVRLPPMIGYLATGFILKFAGIKSFTGLEELSDLGISLLLFSIGLKLDLKSLGRREILGVAMGQSLISYGILLGVLVLFLGTDQWETGSILAFGLTFSSTIFVFKILEDRGDFSTRYGKSSIGVLVIQDILAVLFMAFNANKIPSAWLTLLITMLWPLRLILSAILKRLHHSELLVLFGLTVSFGGAYLFDLVNVKGDLGALILGLLLSKHERAFELNRWLISFKDFFLLGFFLSIGLTGLPGLDNIIMALLISLFVPLRAIIYSILFVKGELKTRDSLLAGLSLSNFSEFGLIVVSFAVSQNFVDASWLPTLALTLTFSFIFSAIFNHNSDKILDRFCILLDKIQKKDNISNRRDIALTGHNVIVIGLGRVGQGAFEALESKEDWKPIGFDVSSEVLEELGPLKFKMLKADATSPEFWQRVQLADSEIKQILLAMPVLRQNALAAKFIRDQGYKGRISSIVKYTKNTEKLMAAGVDQVFNLFEEAGTGFAQNACELKDIGTSMSSGDNTEAPLPIFPGQKSQS